MATTSFRCESGEFYSRSQGWKVIVNRDDDGGFTGGNIERTALKRLLADIEAGNVDVVSMDVVCTARPSDR